MSLWKASQSEEQAPAEPPLLRDSARWHALVSGIARYFARNPPLARTRQL